jgi:hypothetical protein
MSRDRSKVSRSAGMLVSWNSFSEDTTRDVNVATVSSLESRSGNGERSSKKNSSVHRYEVCGSRVPTKATTETHRVYRLSAHAIYVFLPLSSFLHGTILVCC